MIASSGAEDGAARGGRTRTSARLAAVQALYQVDMTRKPVKTVVDEFIDHRLAEFDESTSLGHPDEALFRALTTGTAGDLEVIDGLIAGALVEDWSVERLESTLIAILRVGVHELLSHGETPRAVVISEYVDVTHAFYDDKAAGLVNGILDRIAGLVRDGEETPPEPENGLASA